MRMVETEFPEFTENELQIFRDGFLKFDTDHNGFLQIFELHMMYESIGETKTNAELLKLIAEAGHEAQNRQSLSYRDYLTILLKDKKGLLKSGFGGFTQAVFKQHDESKETGKKANIFEQKAAEMAKEKEREEQIKRQAAMRKAIAQEEREAAQREKERKAKVQEGLAKLKANIKRVDS
jgi:hypothetical protein